MNKGTLRLRMFAGPNGSGKSTFKSIIRPELLGMFINPDEIEKDIRNFDFLDLDHYEIQTTKEEILNFFIKSPLLKTADLLDDARELRFNDGKLSFFNGHLLEMKTDLVPAWFKKALGSKFDIASKEPKKL